MLDLYHGIEAPFVISPELEREKTIIKTKYAEKICDLFETKGFHIKSKLIQMHGQRLDIEDWQDDYLDEDNTVFFSIATQNNTIIDFNISSTSGYLYQDIIIPFETPIGDLLYLNIYHYIPRNNHQFYPLIKRLQKELQPYIQNLHIETLNLCINQTKANIQQVLS